MKFSKMVRSEIQDVLERGNLTKDEEEVFILLSKGCSRVEIQEKTRLSIATIGRIKLRIESKISKL